MFVVTVPELFEKRMSERLCGLIDLSRGLGDVFLDAGGRELSERVRAHGRGRRDFDRLPLRLRERILS